MLWFYDSGGAIPYDLEFIEGLGGGYFSNDVFPNIYSHNLVYYKKGSKTWGTPIDFKALLTSHNEQTKDLTEVTVFPNPINKLAIVEIKTNSSGEPFTFSLYSLLGDEVIHAESSSNKIEIDRGNLPVGLYIYTVKNKQQVVKTGKIIIH